MNPKIKTLLIVVVALAVLSGIFLMFSKPRNISNPRRPLIIKNQQNESGSTKIPAVPKKQDSVSSSTTPSTNFSNGL